MSGDFLETSGPVLAWVLRTTWEASLIALLVLLAQYLLRGRVSARWRYNLWLLVVARLVLPAVPGSRVSPFNLVRLPGAPGQSGIMPNAPVRTIPAAPVPSGPARVPVPAIEREDARRVYVASSDARPARPRLSAQPSFPYVATPSTAYQPAAAPLGAMVGVLQAATPAADLPPQTPVSVWTVEPPRAFTATRRPNRDRPDSPATPPAIASQPAVAPARWFERINWHAFLAIAWIAGVAFVASRLAWVSFRLALAVRKLRPLTDPDLLALARDCAAELRLSRVPQLLRAPDTFGPALVGLLRPRVLLPDCVIGNPHLVSPARASARTPFHRHEVRLILMHELAHLKRHDVAANWLLAGLGALHWFNPVLWLTFRRMRADRELACDEMVLAAAGQADGGAAAYGPTLLKLLQTLSRGRQPVPGVGMIGVLEGFNDGSLTHTTFGGIVPRGLLTRLTNPPSSIRRRIAMIARFDRQQARHRGASFLGITLSALATGVALTGAVNGQQAAEEEARATREVRVTPDAPPAEHAPEAPELPEVPGEPGTPAALRGEPAAPQPPASPEAPGLPHEPIAVTPAVPAEGAGPGAAAPAAGSPAARPMTPGRALPPGAMAPGMPGRGLPPGMGPGLGGTMPGAPAAVPGAPRAAGPGAMPGRMPGGLPGGMHGPGMGRPGGMAPAMAPPRTPRGGIARDVPGLPGMGPGGATPGMGAGGRVEDRLARAADARTAGNLQKPVPIDLTETPLASALDYVADASGIDIVPDWRALEAAGVSKDTPVSLRLRQNVPAEQVIAWLLRNAGGDTIGFAIDHGVVVVSAREQLDRMVITRAYDVGSVSASPKELEGLVRESVNPGSWQQQGGIGSARVLGQQLFVTSTEPNHRQVERLLGLMKAQSRQGGREDVPAPPGMGGPTQPGFGGYPGYPGNGYGGGYPRHPGGDRGAAGGYPGRRPPTTPAPAEQPAEPM